MKWIKRLRRFTELPKANGEIPKCGTSYTIATKQQNGILDYEKMSFLKRAYSDYGGVDISKRLILQPRNTSWRFKQLHSSEATVLWSKQYAMNFSRQYGQTTENGPSLSRDFLVQLWVADRKLQRSRGKRKRKTVVDDGQGKSVYDIQALQQQSGASKKSTKQVKRTLRQPPPSQSVTGLLEPGSPEEARVAPLLARSNLLITRDIEWANLMLGFEQENRYAIVDACYPQSPVGFIREQSNLIARQLLRLRRPFVAYITDGLGNELFRVRRPFWWINSSIYAEIDGKEVGVVHRRWHLWRRIYDLYLGNNQFAVVENPGFWNWTFTLKGIDGEVLGQIDRDWRGFGFEILTDAGQYVIRFGSSDLDSNTSPAGVIQELDVARPLTLSERAVAVALAVSLDNDYFSRHGGGWAIPFIAVGE